MATKPVVVGVDGSEESLRAVEWAALEAKRHSWPLRIVSAPAMLPRMHAYNASPAAIANALRGIAARALDAAITRSEEVAQGLTITTGLLSGPMRRWGWWKAAESVRPCSWWQREGQAVSRRWCSAR